MKKYNVILADPPWAYRVWSKKGIGRTAENHYPTMSIEDIRALPVGDLADDNCALFLWITFPQLNEAFSLIESWGFAYKTVAFVWVKQNKKVPSLFWGLGYWTRTNAEVCLLATRGKPKRQSASVHQVILSPVEQHSIKISPTSKQYVNPMDLNLDYSDDESPLSLKVDFLLSFCDIVVGSKDGLQPVEKTVIDRCVRLVYRNYLEDPRPENMPILEDLYNLLLAQDEKEAHFIATALEIYVTGSLNVFNHRTNVDIDNRIVCYDIKELGKQLKQLGMLVIQDQVWNRVTINRSAGKTTRYYVDEFHLLLKGELASWSVEIWKRFRKWGGIPTGITQNSKDLLASPEITNILENSDFIYMLNQAAGDRQILAKQLNISPHQLSYVTHSGEGEGLLFYGNVILPFIDRFPKDTELYRIMTTRLSEIAAEGGK